MFQEVLFTMLLLLTDDLDANRIDCVYIITDTVSDELELRSAAVGQATLFTLLFVEHRPITQREDTVYVVPDYRSRLRPGSQNRLVFLVR